ASPGSTHGYDIVDHNSLNHELGTDDDFEAFACELQARRMGLILDFVPNHMGLDPSANLWWRNVLQHGQASPYADFFDIDWDPITPELKGRILLPILQDGYGEVLERGELRLAFDAGELQVHYYERQLPVEPISSLLVLRTVLSALNVGTAAGPEQASLDWREYSDVLTTLEQLPPVWVRDPKDQQTRQDVTRSTRERLAALVERSPAIHTAIEQSVSGFNGTPGQSETFDRLH